MNWLGRISQNRTQAQGLADPGEAKGAAKGRVDDAAFAQTLISDKVLKKYGDSLAPSVGDLQAIARAGNHLATHHAARFANAVDQFYSALGRSTDHLTEPTKSETIAASATAMRGLVEPLAHHPVLMPAMAALSSLLEPRAKVDVDPAAHAATARDTVLALVDSVDGREGATSLLFGFRNLVEAYESGQAGLTAAQRPALWGEVTAYLDAVVPREGCDQGELGRVAGLFHRALRANPDDPKAALAQAKASAFENLAAPREAARMQLEQPLEGVEAGSPAEAAHQATNAALLAALEANPAGPASLIASIEGLSGALRAEIPHAAADANASGYASVAQVISLAAGTPAARPVLDYLAEHAGQLADTDAARNVLTRAARVQKPESLAPILLEAHMALMGQDGAQDGLRDALAKLKRLPPGPALNAALALLPHLGHDSAAPLAEALFVESRRAETPEALRGFAGRFMAAHPEVVHQLGDDALDVAVALAHSTQGDLDWEVIEQTADLCASVKGILKKTPLGPLLDWGRDGEAGLLQLANSEAFIHDPKSMLFDLLRAAARGGGKDPLPAARLGMAIAEQLGRLDREPEETDFPRILKDFRGALKDPKTLTYAPADGGVAAVKGQRRSALGFITAHPAIPVELALTAGRALGAKQMAWLNQTLTSTRSHAFGRALRDAVFAAVKMKRLDFIDALARPDLDSKAKEAAITLVAQEHRQDHAAQVPWKRLVEGLNAGKDPVGLIEGEKAQKALAGLDLEGLEGFDPEGAARIDKVMGSIQKLIGFFDKKQYNMPPEHFLPHLRAIVKAQAEGTWPDYKYSTEAAKEHLQGLSEEQKAIWASDMVSGAQAPVAADDAESLEAMMLLKGVAKTMHRQLSLEGRGFKGAGWNKVTLNKLTKQRDELVDKLRRAQKGSNNHRALSRKIGPLQSRVALLELHFALKETFKGNPGSSQAVLARIQPLARNALSPLRKQRQGGFVHALETAIAATKAPPAGNKMGKYAADEDHVEAYLTSFSGGSCINPDDGFNRGALVELMGGSQYKMIRSVDGGKGTGRSFLRLIKVTLPNGYDGHAIAMDSPKSTQGWGAPDDAKSMYEHALNKAVAMGVPLLVHDQTVSGAAKARGLTIKAMQCQCKVHRGITGMHHNEGLNGGDYFINWPGRAGTPRGYDVPDEATAFAERSYNFQVVMPPNWK